MCVCWGEGDGAGVCRCVWVDVGVWLCVWLCVCVCVCVCVCMNVTREAKEMIFCRRNKLA